jgi:hypothetical protein
MYKQTEKINNLHIPRLQNTEQSHNRTINNKSFGNVAKFKWPRGNNRYRVGFTVAKTNHRFSVLFKKFVGKI